MVRNIGRDFTSIDTNIVSVVFFCMSLTFLTKSGVSLTYDGTLKRRNFGEFREFGVFSQKFDPAKCNSRGCSRKF